MSLFFARLSQGANTSERCSSSTGRVAIWIQVRLLAGASGRRNRNWRKPIGEIGEIGELSLGCAFFLAFGRSWPSRDVCSTYRRSYGILQIRSYPPGLLWIFHFNFHNHLWPDNWNLINVLNKIILKCQEFYTLVISVNLVIKASVS